MTSSDSQPSSARNLRRSGSDRRIAGIAGGVASHFGLDPTLVRVAFAILSLLGGIGLALYAVLAIVVPAEQGAPPLTGTAWLAVAAIGVAAIFAFPFAGGSALVLAVPAALAVLVWRLFGGKVDPRLVRVAIVVVAIAGSIALGVTAGIAAAFGAGTVIAVVVIAAGVVLVAGGVRGNARWLVVPALVLAAPATIVEAADLKLQGGVGDREYRPASVSDLRSVYRLGAGELDLDLRDLRPEAMQTVDVTARVGVGEVEITVPRGVCVQTDGHAGVGSIDILGRVNEGVDVDAERGGIAAPGQPTIRVHLKGGVADLRVNRTPADEPYDTFANGRRDHVRSPLRGTGCEG